MKSKRLTMEEVGRLAGVSRSTASRVLNGHQEVSTEVRQRVMSVVEETGYQPNYAARWMVSRRSGIMGLLIPSTVHNIFDDPYFGRLIQGITKAANSAEQTLSLLLFEDESEEFATYRRVSASGQMDGFIITATRINTPITQRMIADRVPIVMVGRPDTEGVPFVDVDNVGGAQLATEHLIEHDRKRIAFIAPPANTTTGQDRLAGYIQALSAAGLEWSEELVREGGFTFTGGYQAMQKLLPEGPDAVFCGSDQMAMGALKAMAEAGFNCPDDISLVSYDGLYEPQQTEPTLTTISQPILVKAERAVRILMEILEGKERSERQMVLPTVLLRRQSCGCSTSEQTSSDSTYFNFSKKFGDSLNKKTEKHILQPNGGEKQ